MKAFKVRKDEIFPCLFLKKDPYPHVAIGEEGRGRELFRFPVSAQFAESLKETARIERASVLKTQKGSLLLVEERNPNDKRALVHLAVEEGFRGDVYWTAPELTKIPCPKQGDRLFPSDTTETDDSCFCKRCGIELSEDGYLYRHPMDGLINGYVDIENVPGVTVLAKGRCANGHAGAVSSHPEYLVILQPGVLLRAERKGRLYGAPPVKYLHWDGETLQFGTYDEVFPPSYEPEEGELV